MMIVELAKKMRQTAPTTAATAAASNNATAATTANAENNQPNDEPFQQQQATDSSATNKKLCKDFLGNGFHADDPYFPLRSRPCFQCQCDAEHATVIDSKRCVQTSCSPQQCGSTTTTAPNACCTVTCAFLKKTQQPTSVQRRRHGRKRQPLAPLNNMTLEQLVDDEQLLLWTLSDADLSSWLQQPHYSSNISVGSDAPSSPPSDLRFGSPMYRFQGRAPTVLEQLPAIGSGLLVALFILVGLCLLSLLNSSNTAALPFHSGGGGAGHSNESTSAAARRRRARRRHERNHARGCRRDWAYCDDALRFWDWEQPPAAAAAPPGRATLVVQHTNEHVTTSSPAQWLHNSIYRGINSPAAAAAAAAAEYSPLPNVHRHQRHRGEPPPPPPLPPPPYWLTMLYDDAAAKTEFNNNHHRNSSRSNSIIVHRQQAESPPPTYDDVLLNQRRDHSI